MKTRAGLPLLCTFLAFAACVLEVKALRVVTPDTWMSLVLGRAIAMEGLPRDNALTVIGQHAAWVDQQWLAHLTLYWLHRAGGFFTLALVRIAVSLACLGLAAVSAVRRGASAVAVSLSGLVVLVLVRPLSNVRAQTFGELCFALVLAVLLEDQSRRAAGARRGRLLFVVPCVLALWANVHGSVLIGVLLVVVATLSMRPRWTESVLLGASALAVFISPYGLGLLPYYRTTLVSGNIRAFATEWQPPAVSDPEGALFYATAIGVVAAAALATRHESTFERVTLVGLAVLSCLAVRNVLFFGLAFAFVAPVWIESVLPERVRDIGSFRGFWVTAWVSTAVAVAWTRVLAANFDDWVDRVWPSRTATEVAALAGPGGTVFAVERHADRLLWQRPELVGRVAYDVRMELLSAEQMQAITDAVAGGRDDVFDPYDVVVVRADADHVGGSPAWKRAFEDPLANVYVPVRPRRSLAWATEGASRAKAK